MANDNRYIEKATIKSGQTKSNIIKLTGSSIVAIRPPTGLEGTSLTFEASEDIDGDFKAVTRAIDGNPVTAVVAADKHVLLLMSDFFGARYIKIISSSTESSERVLELIMKHS